MGFYRRALNIVSYRNFHSSPINRFPQKETSSLESRGPFCTLLKSRSVISFTGPETVKFLQGLLTNDMRRFSEEPNEKLASLPTPNMPVVSTPPLYTAMLTPQGRFLYDLFVYCPVRPRDKLDRTTGSSPGPDSNQEPTLLADVDAMFVDELLECFKKFRLRAKVDIENVSKEFSCWQRFGGKLSEKSSSAEDPEAELVGWGGSVDPTGSSATQGNNLGWRWFKDPRLVSLGFRGIFPSNTTPPLVESVKEVDERYYLLWRLEKGVAEGSTEIPKGEAVPLEYNLVGLNAISFDKGCYVGQELIARTHHRGVIRKRLVPMIFVDEGGKEVEQKVATGSEVVNIVSNKKVGTVGTAIGCRGMGLLRLEDAFEGSCELSIKGQEDTKVKVSRPDWWPSDWGKEHELNRALA